MTMRVRVGRWVIQSMLALAAASASGQPRPSAPAPAPAAAPAPGRGRRAGGAAGAGLALGTQGLRAGALAAGADPHRAQGPGQPDLGRLGLPRHQGRPDHHQLPRRQRGGAEARAPRAGLRHRRRPRGAACDPAARRAARPGPAQGRRRRRQDLRRPALSPRGPAAGPGRAHLLARQSARRRLRGRAGHLQRDGQAELLSADLLRRRALRRDERRAGARRGRPCRRHQRRPPGRRRAGELSRAGELRHRAAGARPRCAADHRPGLRQSSTSSCRSTRRC